MNLGRMRRERPKFQKDMHRGHLSKTEQGRKRSDTQKRRTRIKQPEVLRSALRACVADPWEKRVDYATPRGAAARFFREKKKASSGRRGRKRRRRRRWRRRRIPLAGLRISGPTNLHLENGLRHRRMLPKILTKKNPVRRTDLPTGRMINRFTDWNGIPCGCFLTTKQQGPPATNCVQFSLLC